MAKPDHGEATARSSDNTAGEENRVVLGLSGRGGEEVSDQTIPPKSMLAKKAKDLPVGEELKHTRESRKDRFDIGGMEEQLLSNDSSLNQGENC